MFRILPWYWWNRLLILKSGYKKATSLTKVLPFPNHVHEVFLHH